MTKSRSRAPTGSAGSSYEKSRNCSSRQREPEKAKYNTVNKNEVAE